MRKLNHVELKRARLVPSSVFASPEAVVRATDLSLAQKLQILRRWEFDARRTAGPGSTGADLSGMLSQVEAALASLEGPALRGDRPVDHALAVELRQAPRDGLRH